MTRKKNLKKKFVTIPGENELIYFIAGKESHDLLPYAFSSKEDAARLLLPGLPLAVLHFNRGHSEVKKLGYPLTDAEWMAHFQAHGIPIQDENLRLEDIPKEVLYPKTRPEGKVKVVRRAGELIGFDVIPFKNPTQRGLDFTDACHLDNPVNFVGLNAGRWGYIDRATLDRADVRYVYF